MQRTPRSCHAAQIINICYKMMHMKELPETAELQTFVTTVSSRSISKAARTLGVPRPTVSRRLARLEERLGVRLLRRTSRVMTLTDAGEVLYARTRVVLAAVQDAVVSVERSDNAVRGTLRVSIPPMDDRRVDGLISTFLGDYPEVRLELDASARHVDLIADGYDVALRASFDLPPGLIARNLVRTRSVAVAAPSYLARFGCPAKVGEMAKHRCLAGFMKGEHPATEWPRLRGGTFRIEPILASNNLSVLCAAARAGHGIALLPMMVVQADLQAGHLRTVMSDRIGAETRLDVVYAEREFISPAVRAFVDAAVVWASRELAVEKLDRVQSLKAGRGPRSQ